MKQFFTLVALIGSISAANAQAVATFEDFDLGDATYWCGTAEGETFDNWGATAYRQTLRSGDYEFVNEYTPDYYSWSGYAVSASTETTYTGSYFTEQYNSCVGAGHNGSRQFCVAYSGYGQEVRVVGEPRIVPGMFVTNSAWNVDAYLNGDGFSIDGEDADGASIIGAPFAAEDYLSVTVQAYDADGTATSSLTFDLARGTAYISEWQYVDLSQLGVAAKFTFAFTGSKTNAYGLSSPCYFCIDDFGAEADFTPVATAKAVPATPSATYDLQGRKASGHGLRIVNGRKLIVR